MSTLLQKGKLGLEILSAIVGLIIGVNTLWWQVQQFLPANPLVGHLIETDARLPGDLLEDMKALPKQIDDALSKSKELKKLVPDEKARRAIVAEANDIVERHTFGLTAFDFMRRGFWILTIENGRDRPLRQVQVGFKFVPNRVTAILPGGAIKQFEKQGLINLGDLAPRSETKLFSWGDRLGTTGLTLSHEDGVGEIYQMHPIPRSFWETNGIFVSFKHTTLGLLAIILLYFGIRGIHRFYVARRAESGRA